MGIQPAKSFRLGILGGSFNPVHTGHILLARDAMEAFGLAKVAFVPCARPPHKEAAELAEAGHRLAMLRAALEGDSWADVSDMEIRRGGTSYTVDTLRDMAIREPDASLHFIIGADSLRDLHTWKSVYELLSLCRVVVIARPGHEAGLREEGAIGLKAPWPERLLASMKTGHMIGISSSEIRARVAGGRSIRYLVPDSVDAYIRRHGLYQEHGSRA